MGAIALKYEKPVNIRLEKTHYKQLKKYAKNRNMKVSTVIRKLIEMVVCPLKADTSER